MKPSRLWLIPVNFVLGTLFFILAPALLGQGGPAVTTGLQAYGAANVGQLPPPTKYKGQLKHNLLHVGNSDVFRAKKTKADSGLAAASGATAGPVAPSTVSVGPGPGFDGASFDEQEALLGIGLAPPDTQVAAGAGFVVEVVNIYARIWNMNVSPPAVTTFDLLDFFGTFFSDVLSDPRIRFDPVQQRWYLSCVTIEQTFANPPQGDFRLAISTSSDPTQAFTLYAATTLGAFPDYPHLGFNEDKLVLTGNSYGLPLSASSPFLGTEVLVVSLSDLMNPAITSPHTKFFTAPQGLDTIQPAETLSSTCNGGNCILYMAAVPDASLTQANILRIWSLKGVPGVGAGVTFTTQDLAIPELSIPPGGVQQGSANLIETNDARLLDAIYRNGKLWVASNTGCTPSGDTITRACMHFSQVDTATLTLSQDFVFGTPGEYYYYSAIQIDSHNNLVAVFNKSSSTEYPSIYVSGQAAGAAPGTFETPALVLEGQFPLTPSSAEFNRWGDYSGAHLDSSGNTVWVAGEYVHSASTDDWGTWIASVQFSGGGGGLTPTTTTVGSSANPSTYGQSVTFTATVTPSGTTGTVTFKDGATTLGTGGLDPSGHATFNTSSMGAGPHSITAVYGGDSTFAGSTSTVLNQTVNPAATTTAVSSNANPSTYGQQVTFTATVTSGAGTPSGTVTFKDGATTLGSNPLDGTGHASLSTSTLAVGGHSITAAYAANGNFAGSTSAILNQTVNQAITAATLSSSSNPSAFGQQVTFTATVLSSGGTPTGSVTFKDGTTTLGIVALSGGVAAFNTSTLSVAGSPHSITAVYGGATNFAGSTSNTVTQTVSQASTTTAIASSLNPSNFKQSVTFTATVTAVGPGGGTPAGSVQFKDGNTTLATRTLSSGKAAFSTSKLSKGAHSITTVYLGNSNYSGSTSAVLTQTVN